MDFCYSKVKSRKILEKEMLVKHWKCLQKLHSIFITIGHLKNRLEKHLQVLSNTADAASPAMEEGITLPYQDGRREKCTPVRTFHGICWYLLMLFFKCKPKVWLIMYLRRIFAVISSSQSFLNFVTFWFTIFALGTHPQQFWSFIIGEKIAVT